MKICFFIRTLNEAGGTEKMTSLLANYLLEIGHQVSIIVWLGGESSYFNLQKGIQVYSLLKRKDNIKIKYFKSLIKYYKIKKKIKPNILIDVCIENSIISIPVNFLCKSKIISWEHFNFITTWKNVYTLFSKKLAIKFSDKIIVLTETDKLNYIKIFSLDLDKINVISNPITLETKQISSLEKNQVLAIGRLVHQKGFDLLLKVWALIKADKENCWNLLIIGEGEEKGNLQNLVMDLELGNSVQFIANTKNVEKYYLESSIFMMTSRFEGLPLVLLESKAFGLPIISFDCDTGPRDLIKENVDGFLCPVDDIEYMVSKTKELMNNVELRKRLGKEALKSKENYTPEVFFEKWIDVLKQIY